MSIQPAFSTKKIKKLLTILPPRFSFSFPFLCECSSVSKLFDMSCWQYKGKEGFPTVVVNIHCTATGRIVYCGPIFPGTHNDKTMVHYDKLVDAMRHDALFKDCRWSTCVPNSTGSTHELTGCMTLCDSGYHEWQETMNGYKYPTTCAEGLWSARYVRSLSYYYMMP